MIRRAFLKGLGAVTVGSSGLLGLFTACDGNQDGRIRDGMTAELRIDLPAEVAHLIPQTALTLDDAGRLGVRLAAEGKARFVEIRIIRDEIDGVWVTGLPDRASVIVVGQEFVRDGRSIAPTVLDRASADRAASR